MIRAVSLLAVAAALASAAAAAPLLDAGEAVGSALLLPDHAERGVYYQVPALVRLARDGATPRFFFYKSVGAGAANGVVGLALERAEPDGERVRAWAAERGVRVLPLPVAQVTCRLLLVETAVRPGSSRVVGSRSGPWAERTFSVPLAPVDATLLWDELAEPGNGGLVADLELTTEGYERRIDTAGHVAHERVTRTDRFAVPLQVSRRQFPELFAVVDLADELSYADRTLTVLCFDFSNGLLPELERVTVDLAFVTDRGERERHALVFEADGEPVQRVELTVPTAPGVGFEYRVIRHFVTGEQLDDGWTRSSLELLDVSISALAIEEG